MSGLPGLTRLSRRNWPLLSALPLALVTLLAWQPLLLFACALAETTPAYQPQLSETRLAIEQASRGQLGPAYPALPPIEVGYPQSRPVAAEAPCTILKAIAWQEGGWQQATGNTLPGQTGPVKMSPSCGYGIMQITTGMQNAGELPIETQQKIASDYKYNVGQGAKLLVEKWNAGDSQNAVVGTRDPSVGEDWYYAVWAYNQFNFKNNPNNPDYPAARPAFTGTQPKSHYPYQEVIWGYAANPPKVNGADLWNPVPLQLPDRSLIGQAPSPIPAPAVEHSVACLAAAVSPGSVSWRVVPGAGLQTAQITLNGGPGNVKWTSVVSGGSWLTVAPFKGDTLPATITLTAAPGGLKPGTHTATVVFSVEGNSTEVKVLVEIVVAPDARSYLPLVPKRAPLPPPR